MNVGDPSRFAVEFDSVPVDADVEFWKFGRIRWWCGGTEVGVYRSGTSLRDIGIEVEKLLAYAGRPNDPQLFGAPAGDVVCTIMEAYSETAGNRRGNSTLPRRVSDDCSSQLSADVFDAWQLILTENGSAAPLLWFRFDNRESIGECALPAREFDAVQRQPGKHSEVTTSRVTDDLITLWRSYERDDTSMGCHDSTPEVPR